MRGVVSLKLLEHKLVDSWMRCVKIKLLRVGIFFGCGKALFLVHKETLNGVFNKPYQNNFKFYLKSFLNPLLVLKKYLALLSFIKSQYNTQN